MGVALAGVALSCVLAWKNLAMQGRIETLEASLKVREGELQGARTPSRVAEEAQVQYTENPADGNGEKVASEPAASANAVGSYQILKDLEADSSEKLCAVSRSLESPRARPAILRQAAIAGFP